MIKEHCFQKPWIDGFKRQAAYKKINPPLLEKMIRALSLLQHLKVQGLHFVFKGGTSLILLLENSRRFSVDIDILTEASREQVEGILDRVVEHSTFNNWQLDEHRSYKPGVPKAHYKLTYDSQTSPLGNYILLDILFEKPHYPQLHDLPVQSIWIETDDIITITMPTVEAIIGDKLTAFAPTTTGILYSKGKELEIIKQLFDLGNLFDHVRNLNIVAASYNAFVQQEIAYRKLSMGSELVLMDSIKAARIISFRERNRADPDKSYFTELLNGIRSFGNYLITGRFQIEDAVTAAAKTAYLSARLLRQDYRSLERYSGQDIQHLDITHPDWNMLNKLKRFPDRSAFYYWYQCLNTLGLAN